jgi:hypothetical protein
LKDVGKIVFVLAAAVLLLPWFPEQAQAQYQQPKVGPSKPLAGVQYNNRWEFYGGIAYAHITAGPQLTQGSNLGGFDADASRFFKPRWALQGSVRGYYGTSGAAPNPYGIKGPFVNEYLFVAGPEWRGPSNEHVTTTLHGLVGGAWGRFQSALYDQQNNPVPPAAVGFYSNQVAFASVLGGTVDLNRSPKLAFRISPDAILTNYTSSSIPGSRLKGDFAISVGLVYRMGRGKVK